MAARIDLRTAFRQKFPECSTYFQPPASVKLSYPAIIYELEHLDHLYANNMPYHYDKAYKVTCITKDPDSDIKDRMAMAFPKIAFDRHYTSDNLNHDVFILYW